MRRLAILVLALGCTDPVAIQERPEEPRDPAPLSLTIIEGNNTTAEVATSFPVAVRADTAGLPVVDIRVRFVARQGRVSDRIVHTDSSGIARSFWTLGESAGTHRLRAESDTLSVTFEATALPGPPAEIRFWDGLTIFGDSPLVLEPHRVQDRFDNPVPYRARADAFVHALSQRPDESGRTLVADSSGIGKLDILVADTVIVSARLEVQLPTIRLRF